MRPTDVFVRRPVLAIVVNLVILIAGLWSIRSLSVRQYPRSDIAVIRITTAYIGADPDLVWRIEQFYGAIGLMIEQETGLVASPMLKIYDEGFGRVILITGKLVVLTKHLRDAQRFGFETFAALAAEANKQIAAAVTTIQQFPEAARA